MVAITLLLLTIVSGGEFLSKLTGICTASPRLLVAIAHLFLIHQYSQFAYNFIFIGHYFNISPHSNLLRLLKNF